MSKTRFHLIILSRLLLILSVLGSLASCAVHNDRKGHYVISLDNASLLGNTISEHELVGEKSKITLRELNSQYSLKLSKYMRVIPLGFMDKAKVYYVGRIEDDAIVIVEESSRQCEYGYYISQIHGSVVNSWNMGNCKTKINIMQEQGQLLFNFDDGGRRVLSYQYRNSKLFKEMVNRADFNKLTSQYSNIANGLSKEEVKKLSIVFYRPSAPQLLYINASDLASVSGNTGQSVRAKPNVASSNNPQTLEAKKIIFSTEEKTITTIKLD